VRAAWPEIDARQQWTDRADAGGHSPTYIAGLRLLSGTSCTPSSRCTPINQPLDTWKLSITRSCWHLQGCEDDRLFAGPRELRFRPGDETRDDLSLRPV